MLTEVLAEIKNYFVKETFSGVYEIQDGKIAPLDLKNNQYFRIVGSALNDGVYKYPSENLNDEIFSGEIWRLAIPPKVIELIEEIERFEKSSSAKNSPYVSESWGGYSYTKATDSNGAPIGWKTVFATRLNTWRKI